MNYKNEYIILKLVGIRYAQKSSDFHMLVTISKWEKIQNLQCYPASQI